MAIPQERTYTIDDIYNLPEGVRAELIDGQIYYMASPNRLHQEISGFLYANIYNYIKAKNGTCRVYSAPFAVFLNKDDTKYLEPDINVICDKNKLTDQGCNGAPDWIIEIVSSSNLSHDYITKLSLYKTAGVKEYWIVNPQTLTITLYYFESDIMAQHYTFQDKIKVNIYEDLYINFEEISI